MTTFDTSTADPYATLPLDGLQLIEASAGTGKTYTLATLVLRCVIERGLRLQDILVVTYTDAATQELRKRLRERIAMAAQIADEFGGCAESDDGDEAQRANAYPAFRGDMSGPEPAERVATRALIVAQLQDESPAHLRARLHRAVHDIDLAAVFTIHGFCARVLAEHALECDRLFIGATQLTNDTALREQVAIDLWREFGRDAVQAEALTRWWPQGPQALAKSLRELLRAPRLLPPLRVHTEDPTPRWQAAAQHLRQGLLHEGAAVQAVIAAGMASGTLSKVSYKSPTLDALWQGLDDWSARSGTHAPPRDKLDLLTPDKLARCTNKGKLTPQSPLFDTVAAYLDLDAERDAWLESRHIALLHHLRDAAVVRLKKQKAAQHWQTFDDLIDGVAEVLDGARGEQLVERMVTQYAVALVDEFQDTDARQWKIFQRVFGSRALFLIGDPKQAIYRFRGGDVHTYLAASELVRQTHHERRGGPAPPLVRNFRSRPSLLHALDALYAQAGEHALVDARIRYQPLQPGGGIEDAHFQRRGATAPALTVRVLPPPDDGTQAWSAPESRRIATAECAAHIHRLLRDAHTGRAQLTLKAGTRALRPGDIAVLVRNHREAERMRDALMLAGVPAVAAGRQSLYESEEATEVLTLLEALLRLDDDSRLRGALATTLIGFDAHAIDRLDHDDAWRQRWQTSAQAWRERWLRHGPLPLLSDLCAENAARLLSLHDGERRLTNLLQLGEQLQAAAVQTRGETALTQWLRRHIAEADGDDETQQLRLESDARRVRILTLHKSKGLEFPLVYLPFAGIGRGTRPGSSVEYQHEDGERVLHYKTADTQPDVLAWSDAKASAAYEDNAEDARLLYVGLTRAQHAVWIASGPLYESAKTPLHAMLTNPDALARDSAIEVDASPLTTHALSPLPSPVAVQLPRAREATRPLARDWWIHSFSQWHDAQPRQQVPRANNAASLEARAADEPEPRVLTAQQRRYSGTRFGNALHAVLEHAALGQDGFVAWRDHVVPMQARDMLVAALREQGYPDSELDDGVTLLGRLVSSTLNARLPGLLSAGGAKAHQERSFVRLCDLPSQSRRAELEFHFTLGSVQADRVLALLHAHGISPQRDGFGLRRRLEGLMTGLIDLVYQHDGRWYVLDYKSNQLSDYNAAALDDAMQHSEYLLQALIYTLALHRWLRFRLGNAYDYARDFGGIRYLFCRGLLAEDDSAVQDDAMRGIYARRFDPELIHALDRLFAEGTA